MARVKSINEEILDAMIIHQIILMRYGETLTRHLVAIINSSESDVASLIRDQVNGVPQNMSKPADWQRLQGLMNRVTEARRPRWMAASSLAQREMEGLAEAEVTFNGDLYSQKAPIVYSFIKPSSIALASVLLRPFAGLTLSAWFETMRQDDDRRIRAAIQAGNAQGETPAQVARRVVGSAKLKGADGVTQTVRRNVQSIVLTAVNHVATQARNEFYGANVNVFSLLEMFQAVLDSHTTKLCRSLDGTFHQRGTGPIPPLHVRCRSMRIPSLDPVAMARFPRKAGVTTSDVGSLVAIDSYSGWLREQPVEVQDRVLGRTYGVQFRKGEYKPDKFTDLSGARASLSEVERV